MKVLLVISLVLAGGLAYAQAPPHRLPWGLLITYGEVYDPNDPTPDAGPQLQGFQNFKTKAECEQAAGKAIRAYYAEAVKKGMVATPPGWQCVKRGEQE
jgi:hypothetical protein